MESLASSNDWKPTSCPMLPPPVKMRVRPSVLFDPIIVSKFWENKENNRPRLQDNSVAICKRIKLKKTVLRIKPKACRYLEMWATMSRSPCRSQKDAAPSGKCKIKNSKKVKYETQSHSKNEAFKIGQKRILKIT